MSAAMTREDAIAESTRRWPDRPIPTAGPIPWLRGEVFVGHWWGDRWCFRGIGDTYEAAFVDADRHDALLAEARRIDRDTALEIETALRKPGAT